jgi:putative colanic acid biosynthesis acetyltransferase WcaF
MRLDNYYLGDYTPGAPYWKQLLWYFFGSPLVESYYIPVSSVKVRVLRLFGASVGQGVRIKPGVKVKFPWRLSIGDYVWIGENTWIDNLASVCIENHVCISQGVYFCTGNHNWNHPNFQLMIAPIHIEEGCWIAAKAVIGPGVTTGYGSVLTLGSVTSQSLKPLTIYAGNPAKPIKQRNKGEKSSS